MDILLSLCSHIWSIISGSDERNNKRAMIRDLTSIKKFLKMNDTHTSVIMCLLE